MTRFHHADASFEPQTAPKSIANTFKGADLVNNYMLNSAPHEVQQVVHRRSYVCTCLSPFLLDPQLGQVPPWQDV